MFYKTYTSLADHAHVCTEAELQIPLVKAGQLRQT
jgi:hypothetical protein